MGVFRARMFFPPQKAETMKLELHRDHPPQCPNCRSPKISRSRRRGLEEFLLHYFCFITPYRCRDCDYRYFRYRVRLRAPAAAPSKHSQV
jgi:predicted Zn-ribbon and HTH transcriptional regulator